jgi:hypothetical protein
MKKGFFILLLLVTAFYPSLAQQADYHICGNAEDQTEFIARLEQNKLVMEAMDMARDRGAVQYVPIHFHLVGDADGNGKIKEIRVLEQLCKLNEAFLPAEIQFYLSPHPTHGLFNYSINNNNVYLNQSNSLIMQLRRHPNAINVYIVQEPVSNNNNPGIVLAYYSPLNDWIVSRKTEVNGNNGNGTMPHEVGHFFTLPHTFFGYESNPFDAADPTWPNAPVLAPNGGGVTTERQNGTNCGTAADRICDTPPDYNFGLIWSNCNNYTGGARDPLGTLVDPMENNFMGYFQNCNPYAFTPNQMSIMRADLNSSQRNYLDNTFSPVATEIVSPTNLLVSPTAGEIPPHYNNVLLEWQAIPGATHYLVEIDIIPGFATVNAQTFIETGTSKLLTNLLSNRTYYWRVKPFNQLVGCATVRSQNFKTSTVALSTLEIEGLEAWQISPNPVHGGTATINVVSEKSLEVAIRITDAAGRTVSFQQGLSFPQGESTHTISTANLPNGLYFVSLESGNGRNVRKLSVLR